MTAVMTPPAQLGSAPQRSPDPLPLPSRLVSDSLHRRRWVSALAREGTPHLIGRARTHSSVPPAPAAGVPVPPLGHAGLGAEQVVLTPGDHMPHARRDRMSAPGAGVGLLPAGHGAHRPGQPVAAGLGASATTADRLGVQLRVRLAVGTTAGSTCHGAI